MKTCQHCKKDFEITADEAAFYEKIHVPEPTFCPQCRMIRRFSFRRTRVLYKRKVEGSDKEVLTPFHPDSPVKIYHADYWKSDKWDAKDYGRDYDFSRPFFEQLKELMLDVPFPHSYSVRNENSDFSNDAEGLKNCYLVFNSGWSEDCYYGNEFLNSRQCMDCTNVHVCQLCYDCLDCEKCFECVGCQDCVSCTNVQYSYNLSNCTDCIGSVNLKHKQYYIFNEQYTKEEYEKKLAELKLDTHEGVQAVKKKAAALRQSLPQKYMHGSANEDVSGDYLNHCKNTHDSFINKDLEDCKYNQYILFLKTKDCHDITVAGGELCYELEEAGGYNVRFSWGAWPKNMTSGDLGLADLDYVVNCFGGYDLFGCVGLKSEQYCILNKKYEKDDYFALREKIINHMNEKPYIDPMGREYRYGEFLPPELSITPYNETLAQEYFPLTKEGAEKQGFQWRDESDRTFEPTVSTQNIPSRANEAGKEITSALYGCEHDAECLHGCTKAFKVIPQELAFYQKHKLPLPHLCVNCRHYSRIEKRNHLRLRNGECDCTQEHDHHLDGRCPNTFRTTFEKDTDATVYCDTCFEIENA